MNTGLKLQKGINLGGWLSQYHTFDHDHFSTFIQDADIARIADWGMDHVRLPVDYPILEEKQPAGDFTITGFAYLDRCLAWCQKYNLKLLIDLHKAPGYVFDCWKEASLFNDPALSQRFLHLWTTLTEHFHGVENLAFELLNEVMLPDSAPWNLLVGEAISAIHAIDPARCIMLGSNHHNKPDQLQYLELYEDERILYTFHYYHPMVVTHQHAYWVPVLENLEHAVGYPGPYPDIDYFGKEAIGKTMDRCFLKAALQPALDFMEKTGKTLYCGEFGVIDCAPMATRINWTRDMLSLFSEHGIGWAVWSYKAMDFGLVDRRGEVVNEALVQMISQRQA